MLGSRGRIILTSTVPADGSVTLAALDPDGDPGQVPTINGGGTAVEWATPSGGGAPSVLSDAMDGTGWTDLTPSGSGDASWPTGPARLLLNCDAGGASSCGVEAANYLDRADYYDLAACLDVLSGDNSSDTRIGLAVGQDETTLVTFSLWTNNTLEVGVVTDEVFTSIYSASVPAIDATVRQGGNLNLRVSRSPAGVVWLWGVGSGGALPTVWNEFYSTVRDSSQNYARTQAANLASNGRYVQLSALTLAAVDLDVAVSAIRSALPGAFGGA